MQIRNFNLMVLTETKFSYQAYFHYRMGYNVVCSPAIAKESGGAQGGVRLAVRDQPKGFSVESALFHGPNVVSCKVIGSGKRTLIIGSYLPPSTLYHLPYLEEALT